MAFERNVQRQSATLNIATEADMDAALAAFPSVVAGNITLLFAGTKAAPAFQSFSTRRDIKKLVAPGNYLYLSADDSAWSGFLVPDGGGADFITIDKAKVPTWSTGDWWNTGTSVGASLSIDWTNGAAGRYQNAGYIGTVTAGITETAIGGGAGTGYWRINVTPAFPYTMVSPTGSVISLKAAGPVMANSTDELFKIMVDGEIVVKNLYLKGKIFQTEYSSGQSLLKFYNSTLNGYAVVNAGKWHFGYDENGTIQGFGLLNGRLRAYSNHAYLSAGGNLAGGKPSYLTKGASDTIYGSKSSNIKANYLNLCQCNTSLSCGVLHAESGSSGELLSNVFEMVYDYNGYNMSREKATIYRGYGNTYVSYGTPGVPQFIESYDGQFIT